MTREELVEASKVYFESHPKEGVFFATSDGMFFTFNSRSDALAHAMNLGSSLETIERMEVFSADTEAAKLAEEQKLAEEAAALAEEQRIADEAAKAEVKSKKSKTE